MSKNLKTNIIDKLYEMLPTYKGGNPYIAMIAREVSEGKRIMNDFEVKYVRKNFNYEPFDVNSNFHLTEECGEHLKEKYKLEFAPKIIKITKVIGEMGGTYHCYAQYRQSVRPKLMFISRRGILGTVRYVDPETIDVDFSEFDNKTAPRKLKEHQKTGIKFMLANKKCINADDMGLGKSTQSLVAALVTNSEHILVITTASLKTTWRKEAELYLPKEEVAVINGKEWISGHRVTIVNYDIMQNFYEVAYEPVMEEHEVKDASGKVVEVLKTPVMVKNKKGEMVPKMKKSRKKTEIDAALENSPLFNEYFGCVIIDEAHKLSNTTSTRYKVISDYLKKADPEYVFLLTGTPLTNRPMNLYNVLNLIDADVCKNYKYFTERYCGAKERTRRDGHKFITFGEPSNLDELKEAIKRVYIRRLASDIGTMVNKTIKRLYFDLTEEQREEYNRLWSDYQKAQEGTQLTLSHEFDIYFSEEESENDKYRQLIEGGLIRQFFGREMVKHTKESVDELLEDGEKVVIITVYKEEMRRLKEYYGDSAVCYDGSMTTKQKDKAQDAFNNDPKVKVFIGQIIATSVGLSLPSARYLFFNNYDWVAANNTQAESRIHRITSTRDVTCTYMLFNDSISEEMFNKVVYKEMLMLETIKSEKEK